MATLIYSAGDYRTPQGRLRLVGAAQQAELAKHPELGRGTALAPAQPAANQAASAASSAGAGARSGPSFATRMRHEDGPRGAPGAETLAADAGGGTLGFDDLIDLINPLQHIPVISTLYRAVTGDQIQAPVKVAGGALFGGPVGFVAALANAFIDEAAGRDVGEMALAALIGEDSNGGTQVAAAQEPAPPDTANPPTPTADAEAAAPAATRAAEPAAANGETPLTGQAALRAFAADLRALADGAANKAEAEQGRTSRGDMTATPAAATPVTAMPLGATPLTATPLSAMPLSAMPAAPAAGRPAPDAAPSATAPATGFVARMMQALDRYEAMSKTSGTPRPGAAGLDTGL